MTFPRVSAVVMECNGMPSVEFAGESLKSRWIKCRWRPFKDERCSWEQLAASRSSHVTLNLKHLGMAPHDLSCGNFRLQHCLVGEPLMCLLESLAETVGEVASFSALCRDVHRRLWVEESVAENNNGGGRRLLTPVCCMQAHTSYRRIHGISSNSLRRLSLLDTSCLALPGFLWLPLASESLQHFEMSMTRPHQQDLWPMILDALSTAPIFRLKRLELRGLSFQSSRFQSLAKLFESSTSLQEVTLDFKETAGTEEDSEFWRALEKAPLQKLHLNGLRLPSLCAGLRSLSALQSLRCLSLGFASADALVAEESGEDLIQLLAAGQQMSLELQSLAVFGLSQVGNLQLLLEILPFLRLRELDLSYNAVAQAMLEPFLQSMLETSHLSKLNLTGGNLCLSTVLGASSIASAPILQEL
eukprot:symbB.v1.2.036647.t1/scaffold5159.1/size30249/1